MTLTGKHTVKRLGMVGRKCRLYGKRWRCDKTHHALILSVGSGVAMTILYDHYKRQQMS